MNVSPVIHSFLSPILASLGGFAVLICTFFLVWGGVSYITSSGNPTKLVKSKRMLTRSLLGLVVVLSASAIALILTHTYGGATVSSINKLPDLSAVKPASAGGGLVGILISAITGVLKTIVETVGRPFISALNYFTKSTPLLTHSSSVVHLWVICSGIADGLLVLVVALLGFHIMGAEQLGLRDVNLSSLVPQLIFAFILINTSIYVLDGAIELSNVMITAVRLGIGNNTPWQALLNVVGGASGYSLAALVIFVVFLVFSVILLIYYVGRIVALYLGAVLAPIIILLWLIPGFRDFAENALKTYLATVFVLFIHVIILGLAGSLFAAVITSSHGSPDPIMSLLLGLATLIALIKTQGVLMQLNYMSIGPRYARRLGSSFVNGMSYLALSARHSYSGTIASAASSFGEGAQVLSAGNKPKINRGPLKTPSSSKNVKSS